MKVLTVRQPWAGAIVAGAKDVENRSRGFQLYTGELLVHAGAAWSDRGALDPRIADWWGARGQLTPERLPTMAIVGQVTVVDAHHAHPGCCDTPWAETRYERSNGEVVEHVVHLRLADAVEFRDPIPNVRGRLGLWTPPPLVPELAALEASLVYARQAAMAHAADRQE